MIQLRNATITDLPILRYWDQQPHVVASDPNDDWNWGVELQRTPTWREQLIAELNGKPIGFIQIIDPFNEETNYWGDISPNLRAIDIWIGDRENLRRGYGSIMMALALERCFADPSVSAVMIDPLEANVSVRKFYEKFGFKFIENRIFGEDRCRVYRLDRDDWIVR
jgi:aminoglycoside 6'-N-acetyltransferase